MDLAHLLKRVSAQPRLLRKTRCQSLARLAWDTLASVGQLAGHSSKQQSLANQRQQRLEIPAQRYMTPPLI